MKEINVNVEYNTTEQSIMNRKFQPDQEYVLISDKDMTLHNVDFKAGKKTIMTGLLAELCIKHGNGHIKLYNPKEEKVKEEKELLKKLKEEVEELKKTKKETKKKKKEEIKEE